MAFLGISAIDRLINELTRLPGIGRKTAQRLAIFILKGDKTYAHALADAIYNLHDQIHFCPMCFNVTEQELCTVCSDQRRDRTRVCVVEDIVDVMAIEESHEYRGLYHVLSGVISPLAGVSPRDLHIQELYDRVQKDGIEEIILALNPSTEGEATMIYIAHMLKNLNIHITRIASGVPIGSHLEFLDTATIGRAILTRRDL